MEAKALITWALLAAASIGGSALIVRGITYLIDIRFLSWALLILAGLIFIASVVFSLMHYHSEHGMSGFGPLAFIAGLLAAGAGLGGVIGSIWTLRKGGRRS